LKATSQLTHKWVSSKSGSVDLSFHNTIKQRLENLYQSCKVICKPINNFVPMFFVVESVIMILNADSTRSFFRGVLAK
jgi:Holliday junction resolvasome RuvABC endonuclease subunit